MSVALSGQARKAWVGFAISALTPIAVLLLATDTDLTVRLVLASLVSGILAGLGVFATPNTKAETKAIDASSRRRNRHEAEEDSSPQEGF